MRLLLLLVAVAVAALVFLAPSPAGPDSKPAGIDKRVPWTTSKIKGSPEPPPPFRSEAAFPKLKFFEPLDLANVPGKNRLAVATRPGKIFTFVNDPRTEKADLLLDVKKIVYAVTFHPQFAKNGYFYVTYIVKDETPNGTRVARFQVKGDDPPKANPASEKVIFEWPAGGHNAGCLKFGPDGYLYIGTGDGSGIADELHTGQNVGDLLSSILRIDVDRPDADKAYSIPKDNPLVNHKGARPEIWAYGLRAAVEIQLRPRDRRVVVRRCRPGPVGDGLSHPEGRQLWLERHGRHARVSAGAQERADAHPQAARRASALRLPQPHRRLRLSWQAAEGPRRYLHLRRLRHRPHLGAALRRRQSHLAAGADEGAAAHRQLRRGRRGRNLSPGLGRRADPSPGTDAEGDPDHRLPAIVERNRTIRLDKGPQAGAGADPLFGQRAAVVRRRCQGTLPRHPGGRQDPLQRHRVSAAGAGAPRGWKFPDGTVAVKTFALDMEKGDPKSRKRLETRILHFQQLGGSEEVGDQYWRGYIYVWNDEQTDATLLDSAGLDRVYTIKDKNAPGGQRKQTWHFPSRAECTLCHTMPAKFVLGVNTLQLNKDHDYGDGRVANQLRTFEHLGLFAEPLPAPPEKLPHLVNYEDPKLDINRRARSYLHANCSHCHMKWGGGNAEFQLLATLALKDTGTVGTRTAHGDFGLKDPRVLAPGEPDRSMVLHRMKLLGLGRMPHVASSVVDDEAVQLVHDWIKQMPKDSK